MSVTQEKSELDTDLQTDVQPVVESEPEAVVLNSGELTDMTHEVAEDMVIESYRASASDVHHQHTIDKHDVREAFNVREEFVNEHFTDYGILPNDHAAMWLMVYHKHEFINSDERIFNDVPDTDSDRWSRIDRVRQNAPIAPDTQRDLRT